MNKEINSKIKNEIIELYEELDLKNLLSKIAEKIKIYLNCEESTIFLYDKIKEELYFEIATGEKSDKLKKIKLKKGQGIVGWVVENNKSAIVNDCKNDKRFTSAIDNTINFKTESVLAVPVRYDNSIIGVLEAINKKGGLFDEDDFELIKYISNLISIPLQNAVLFKEIKQEIKEKTKLIELAKFVFKSFSYEEVFNSLKEIALEFLQPEKFYIKVNSKNKLYKLICIENDVKIKEVDETNLSRNEAFFPLKTENKSLGYMYIQSKKTIPEETYSLLRGLSIFAALSIEKYEYHKKIIERERVEKELEIARGIQRSFLPKKGIKIENLDIAYINIPSSSVGGDYFDIIRMDNNKVIFSIDDIAGHGIPASLLMSIFRTTFVFKIKESNSIEETIKYLNSLISNTTDNNLYVTSFTCEINTKSKTLKYINAGHNPPILIRKDEITYFDKGSLVLGLFDDVDYFEVKHELESNDLILLFTDGLMEAENPKGEQFGMNRVIKILKDNKNLNAEQILNKIIKSVKKFIKKQIFEDDLTIIIIKVI